MDNNEAVAIAKKADEMLQTNLKKVYDMYRNNTETELDFVAANATLYQSIKDCRESVALSPMANLLDNIYATIQYLYISDRRSKGSSHNAARNVVVNDLADCFGKMKRESAENLKKFEEAVGSGADPVNWLQTNVNGGGNDDN